jgi:YD repeat-containing protein
MKRPPYLYFIVLILLGLSCTQKEAEVAQPVISTCTLKKTTQINSTPSVENTIVQQYEYDTQDRPIQIVSTTTTLYKNSSGTPTNQTLTTTTYTYDSNGHLSQMVVTTGVVKTIYAYQYQAGFLTKMVMNTMNNQLVIKTETHNYNYDNNGKITEHSINTGIIETISYNSSGIATQRVFTNSLGVAIPWKYVLNDKGFITEEWQNNSLTKKYIYDSKNRPITIENWINGQKNSENIVEYSDYRTADFYSQFSFKGHPTISSLWGNTDYLHKADSFYTYTTSSTRQKQRDIVYTHQVSEGIIVKTTYTSTTYLSDNKTEENQTQISYDYLKCK